MKQSIRKNRNFILFLFGYNTSAFGDSLLTISLSLYVMLMTKSALQFSSVLMLGFLPRFLLAPFAGVIVDRMKKKNILVLLDILRGLMLLLLFGISLKTPINLTMIYSIVILFAVSDIFFSPATVSVIPRIVKKEEITDANAISQTFINTINTISPLIASVIFSSLGLSFVLLIDAITFFVSAISEGIMTFDDQKILNKINFLKEMKEGIKVITKDIRVVSLVINGGLSHIFLFPFIEVGLTYLILIVFKGEKYHYGVIQSSISIASIIAGFIALSMKNKKSISENINIGIIGMIIAVIGFSFMMLPGFIDVLTQSKYLPVVYLSIASFIMFFAFSFYGVFFRTFYQSVIQGDMLGRFTSLLIMIISGSRLIGMRMYGHLFETGQLHYPIIILLIGMFLKLVVHIPFLKKDKLAY